MGVVLYAGKYGTVIHLPFPFLTLVFRINSTRWVSLKIDLCTVSLHFLIELLFSIVKHTLTNDTIYLCFVYMSTGKDNHWFNALIYIKKLDMHKSLLVNQIQVYLLWMSFLLVGLKNFLFKLIWEGESSIGSQLHASSLGIEPITWVCALTGNPTHHLLVYRTVLQPTEPQGKILWINDYSQLKKIQTYPN